MEGEPGLVVRVGGRVAAAFALQPDGITIEAEAPNCDGDGPVEVEVCTDLGCASVAAGFDYDCPGPPVITALVDNAGEPGQVFTLVGEDLDRPGLSVRVGGRVAQATVLAGGLTLEVVAPACDGDGFAEVEVCTDLGCDSEINGFDYDCPGAPVITGLFLNAGEPGHIFVIEGTNLDRPGLRVTVAGVEAVVTVEPEGRLTVVAPACARETEVTVQVCTDLGCDSAVDGFTYTGGATIRTSRQ